MAGCLTLPVSGPLEPLMWCMTAPVFPRKLRRLSQLTWNSRPGSAAGLEVSPQALEAETAAVRAVRSGTPLPPSGQWRSCPLALAHSRESQGEAEGDSPPRGPQGESSFYPPLERRRLWPLHWESERSWEDGDSPESVVPVTGDQGVCPARSRVVWSEKGMKLHQSKPVFTFEARSLVIPCKSAHCGQRPRWGHFCLLGALCLIHWVCRSLRGQGFDGRCSICRFMRWKKRCPFMYGPNETDT